MNINQIIIEGRVAVDPKRAEKVDAVTFSLANNRSFKAKDSEEWQEETFFVQVVSFNKLAEKVEKTLKKGMPILVVGRLSIRSYETKNGEKIVIFCFMNKFNLTQLVFLVGLEFLDQHLHP